MFATVPMALASLKKSNGLQCCRSCGLILANQSSALRCTTSAQHWTIIHLLRVPPVKAEAEPIALRNRGKRRMRVCEDWRSDAEGAWMTCCSYSRNVEVAVWSHFPQQPRWLHVPTMATPRNQPHWLGFTVIVIIGVCFVVTSWLVPVKPPAPFQ